MKERGKTMKKPMRKTLSLLTVMLVLTLAFPFTALAAVPSESDLFRYIPTYIEINGDEAVVEGYFVNMSNKTLTNIRDMEMTIYEDEESLMTGAFSSSYLNGYEFAPKSITQWTFTYTDAGRDFSDGTHVVDSNVYALFSCSMSSK